MGIAIVALLAIGVLWLVEVVKGVLGIAILVIMNVMGVIHIAIFVTMNVIQIIKQNLCIVYRFQLDSFHYYQ